MNVTTTPLPGLILLEPRVFPDDRGYFLETWNEARYHQAGLPARFVQDNCSFSTRGIVRGLHYQHPTGQGKLISVRQGEIFDVAVDIRVGSPTFGHWWGVILSDTNHRQLYVPEGFAHGFSVTGETAVVSYKCTTYYTPSEEGSIRWDDPALGIDWKIQGGRLSPKDATAPLLRDVPRERLPHFEGS